MNNYMFWNNYLKQVYSDIKRIINEKEIVYTDFHIHSDYSSDGKQTLEEIIQRSKDLGLDIIAITDHDSIGVYDDLYEYLQHNEITAPIIVPGIEFTVENSQYGSQCHILQLMINPKEKRIMEDVKYNYDASWNRVRLQFKRIDENKTLQYFFNKYDIAYSVEEYRKYLDNYIRPIPEYITLCDYLIDLFKKKNVTVWDVLAKLEEFNKLDKCDVRREMKDKRYAKLREKYEGREDADYSSRFLLSCIAVKGVDDDYFPEYESCGSLSVNNYGELKLEELNKNHLTIFAHPNEDKIWTINNALRLNNNICGLEYNKQSNYQNSNLFYNKLEECDLMMVIGSDSHTKDSIWYDDIEFYKTDKKELEKVIEYSQKYYSLGLNKDKVSLSDENPNWKEIFEMEKEKLQNIIGDKALAIEHVGSTAIPGLKAKPIIDISVAVRKLEDALEFKDAMIVNGYNFRDDGGMKGEYLFSKGPEECRTHYIHVVAEDSKRFHDHIVFRDYLIAHPDVICEYEKVKEELVKKYSHDRKKYTEGKAEFITKILELAKNKKEE